MALVVALLRHLAPLVEAMGEGAGAGGHSLVARAANRAGRQRVLVQRRVARAPGHADAVPASLAGVGEDGLAGADVDPAHAASYPFRLAPCDTLATAAANSAVAAVAAEPMSLRTGKSRSSVAKTAAGTALVLASSTVPAPLAPSRTLNWVVVAAGAATAPK